MRVYNWILYNSKALPTRRRVLFEIYEWFDEKISNTWFVKILRWVLSQISIKAIKTRRNFTYNDFISLLQYLKIKQKNITINSF